LSNPFITKQKTQGHPDIAAVGSIISSRATPFLAPQGEGASLGYNGGKQAHVIGFILFRPDMKKYNPLGQPKKQKVSAARVQAEQRELLFLTLTCY
jgi:hypothetical protein